MTKFDNIMVHREDAWDTLDISPQDQCAICKRPLVAIPVCWIVTHDKGYSDPNEHFVHPECEEPFMQRN